MEESGTRVAIVGEREGIETTVRRLDVSIVAPDDAEVVFAVGEDGFRTAVVAGWTAPIAVIGLNDAYYSVSAPSDAGTLERLLERRDETRAHPLVAVTVDGTRIGTAVFDVTLVTGEPARISEYGVVDDGELLQSFRSDAIVVATPAGSTGYARAAGGPVLRPGTGLVVVPVAPFATEPDMWVVDRSVTLSVERDDEPVDLVIDDDVYGAVDPDEPVTVSTIDHVNVVDPGRDRHGLVDTDETPLG